MNPDETARQKEVDQFILDEIDSVPHLEALLLLWNSRPKQWTLNEMAKSLYVSPETAQQLLQDLERQNLVTSSESGFCYRPGLEERDLLLEAVDQTYRRELVRISRMIHSKASPAIREFARAFRFKKERD
jgi:DNA-binding IclR family transcriptional regulator